MNYKWLPHKHDAELCRLHSLKWSLQQIADEMGFSKSMVRTRLSQLGLTPNNPPPYVKKVDWEAIRRNRPLPVPTEHPYDYHRARMPHIRFAEYVLEQNNMIVKRGDVEFIDGKYATPFVKVQAANKQLKAMGLPQITAIPGCMV